MYVCAHVHLISVGGFPIWAKTTIAAGIQFQTVINKITKNVSPSINNI